MADIKPASLSSLINSDELQKTLQDTSKKMMEKFSSISSQLNEVGFKLSKNINRSDTTTQKEFLNTNQKIENISIQMEGVVKRMETNMETRMGGIEKVAKNIYDLGISSDALNKKRYTELEQNNQKLRKYLIGSTILLSTLIVILAIIMTVTIYGFKNIMSTMETKYENLETYTESLEDDIAITTAKLQELETKESNEAETVSTKPLPINTVDITKPSNLTAEQLDKVINMQLTSIGRSNTELSGLGTALHEMENIYNVNALFCLAVASLESGHGTSSAAVNKNNLFGLTKSSGLMTFNSHYDGVMYWGKLIRNSYINKGYASIGTIQKKYCPPSNTWSGNVNTLMIAYGNHAKQVNS